jgi:hypothetical protein
MEESTGFCSPKLVEERARGSNCLKIIPILVADLSVSTLGGGMGE